MHVAAAVYFAYRQDKQKNTKDFLYVRKMDYEAFRKRLEKKWRNLMEGIKGVPTKRVLTK
jgi:hypothetical protein